MKLIFTADWHIKLHQKNVPIEWNKNRYRMLYQQLNEKIASNNIELLIIGGDLFDRVPNLDELELYFEFLTTINSKIKIIIYSGNHEALKKSTTFLSNLKVVTEKLNSNATIIDDFITYNGIDFIPYNKLKAYYPQDIDFTSEILCTHVRGEIPPHVQPEIDLSLLDRWKVVLAGDLHSHSNSQRNIIYPGSPVTTSFHRDFVDTGVLIVDTDIMEYTWEKLNLPQLIRKTVSNKDDMRKTDYHHTIYELEGDLAELAGVSSNELLDKKVLKRESTSSLNLKDMTIQEELKEYLIKILGMESEKVNDILQVLNDYTKNIGME